MMPARCWILFLTLPRRLICESERFSDTHRNLNLRALRELFDALFVIDSVRYFGYVAYPLLAFPDILDVVEFVALKALMAAPLMYVDRLLARIPLVRALGYRLWQAFLFVQAGDLHNKFHGFRALREVRWSSQASNPYCFIVSLVSAARAAFERRSLCPGQCDRCRSSSQPWLPGQNAEDTDIPLFGCGVC